MSSELYIQKNQSGEYHIFDDDNHQYWGPFFNLSDAQEILAQIEPRTREVHLYTQRCDNAEQGLRRQEDK
jgi:hypothetical protein